jgi:hypothetical protein
MSRRRKWSFLWILIPIVVVGAFLFLFINYLLNPALYKNIIQKSLTNSFGREVTFGQVKINVWGGLGIAFEDFRIKDPSLPSDFLWSKRLIIEVNLPPLLRREVKWKRIILEEPKIHLLRNKNGRLDIFEAVLTGEGIKGSSQKMIQTLSTLFGGSITIRNGTVSFSDESLGDSPLITEIHSFNLHLSNVSYDQPFPFRLNGKIIHSQREGRFSIAGTIEDIPEGKDFSKGKVKAEVEIKGVDTFHFWPYLKALLPMKRLSGTLDLSAHYQGDFQGSIKTSGKIKLKEVLCDYPQVFSSVFTPEWVNIDFDTDYDLKDLRIPRFSIELPEIMLKAKGKIYGIGSKEMGLEAEAQSGPFDLSEGKKFIPFRIIAPSISDPLFRAEGKGPVQILSVKLSGKMPEIDHCDELKNAHVLSVEMKLNGVRMKLPWEMPTLEGIKGLLIFKNGNLDLKSVEGSFFHSTLENVHGVFYELLNVPTLQIESEGRFDLKDLSSLAKVEIFPKDVAETLSSIQIQSGRARYQISAKGVIKPPLHFRHQGSYLLSNTRLTLRQVPFPIQIAEGQIDLSSEDLRWSQARVEFGESSLLTAGSWRHGEKATSFEAVVRGRVDLKNLLSLSQTTLSPEEIRSKAKEIETLSGAGQISFKLKSLSSPSSISYEGEFIPKEASLRQKGMSFPLVFNEGIFSFSNLGIGFSKMRIQLLNSFLFLDGDVRNGKMHLSTMGSLDLRNLPLLFQLPFFSDSGRSQMNDLQDLKGEANVSMKWQGGTADWMKALKEGQVRLKGVSFSHRKVPLPLSQIEGSILLSPEKFEFQAFKGKLGETQITVSSTIPRTDPLAKRRIFFLIASPLLDLDLFLLKRTTPGPTSFKGFRELLSDWQVEGKVEADQVRYKELFYRELQVEMKTVDEKLQVHPFQFKGAGGDFWGEGWIAPTEKGVRFEIKPRLSNMEAKAFLRTLFQKGEEEGGWISGRVHIDKAGLQGEGEDFQKVKESLNGGLRFEIEKGVIERFNILSKIFTLLNVSQLFKGRLPDLKTKGLPFRNIMATIQIKNGVASTDDFLVDSDSMRITIFGKVDLGKHLIDARVGVHPLVTVDTILSNVPIAGYILTGKDKAFISFIYEVEGNLDDPKIEAIPIKSLGEGFWGIIKRFLETPIRPFQKDSSSNGEKK